MTRLQEMKMIAEGAERNRLEAQKQLDAQRLRADTAVAERNALRDKLELAERDLLAAERRYEEMATARDCIATNYNQLSYGASICKDKLAAAEQRIATLVALLGHAKLAVDDVADNCESQEDWATANSMHSLSLKIDAALNPKPEAGSHE